MVTYPPDYLETDNYATIPHQRYQDIAENLEVETMIEKQTLTIAEAAKVLGIGRAAAYEAARIGTLPSIRIGRRLVVPKAALSKLLNVAPNNERVPPHNEGDAT